VHRPREFAEPAQCLAKKISFPGWASPCHLDLYDLATTTQCLARYAPKPAQFAGCNIDVWNDFSGAVACLAKTYAFPAGFSGCRLDVTDLGGTIDCLLGNVKLPPPFKTCKLSRDVGALQTCVQNQVANLVSTQLNKVLGDFTSKLASTPLTGTVLGCDFQLQGFADAATCLVTTAGHMAAGTTSASALPACLAKASLSPGTLTCLQNKLAAALPPGVGDLLQAFRSLGSLFQCVQKQAQSAFARYTGATSVGDLWKKLTSDAGAMLRNVAEAARNAVVDTIPQLLSELKVLGSDTLNAELNSFGDPIEIALRRAGQKVSDKAGDLVDFAWNKIAGVASKLGPVSCFVDFVSTYRDAAKPKLVDALKSFSSVPVDVYVNKIRPAVIQAAKDLLDQVLDKVIGKETLERMKDAASRAMDVVGRLGRMTTGLINVLSKVGADVCANLPGALSTVQFAFAYLGKPSALFDVLGQVAKDKLGSLIREKGGKLIDSIFAAIASALHITTGVADSVGGLVPEVGAAAIAFQSTVPLNLAFTVLTYVAKELVLQGATSVVGLGVDLVVKTLKGAVGDKLDQLGAKASGAIDALKAKIGPFASLAGKAVGALVNLLADYLTGPGKQVDAQAAQALQTVRAVLQNGLPALCPKATAKAPPGAAGAR
jgi:hypothetical protein